MFLNLNSTQSQPTKVIHVVGKQATIYFQDGKWYAKTNQGLKDYESRKEALASVI